MGCNIENSIDSMDKVSNEKLEALNASIYEEMKKEIEEEYEQRKEAFLKIRKLLLIFIRNKTISDRSTLDFNSFVFG